jgi:hypothetical protein
MPPVEPYQMVAESDQMMGVSLRQGWGRRVELAADGLDEFRRKEAYRDGLLLALFELGIKDLRVPIADLANADVRQRLSDFVKLGFEFTVYSLGPPEELSLRTIATHSDLIVNWEIILPEHTLPQINEAVRRAQRVFPGQLFLAPVVPIKESDGQGKTFQHFASQGFSRSQLAEAENWLSLIDDPDNDIGLTFRVSPWEAPGLTIRQIDQQCKCLKLINLQLPREDEGLPFEDDQKLGAFIVEAFQASRSLCNTTVFMDTFIDSDRGYYPRIGLLDRRFNPRPAFYALKLASIISKPSEDRT